MRYTGKSFRILLEAIRLTSDNYAPKKNVMVYASNQQQANLLFDNAMRIIESYSGAIIEKFSKGAGLILFVNGKTLHFKRVPKKHEHQEIDHNDFFEFADLPLAEIENQGVWSRVLKDYEQEWM